MHNVTDAKIHHARTSKYDGQKTRVWRNWAQIKDLHQAIARHDAATGGGITGAASTDSGYPIPSP